MVEKGYNYTDTCVIKRSTGSTDNTGEEIFSVIYDGCCDLQYGGSGDTSYKGGNLQSSPILFLPKNDIEFKINDSVVVSSGLCDRRQEFTIEQWESIGDSKIPEMNDTEIWLKGGTDVQ